MSKLGNIEICIESVKIERRKNNNCVYRTTGGGGAVGAWFTGHADGFIFITPGRYPSSESISWGRRETLVSVESDQQTVNMSLERAVRAKVRHLVNSNCGLCGFLWRSFRQVKQFSSIYLTFLNSVYELISKYYLSCLITNIIKLAEWYNSKLIQISNKSYKIIKTSL